MPAERKTVVVTGASLGVGRATARAFASRGDRVALLARDSESLQAAERDVRAAGGEPLRLPVDVADADAVEDAAEQVENRLGPIDVWVNDAMVSVFSPVRQLEASEVRRVTDVTYLGVVHGTLSALRRMLERDAGVIVQVGSALCYRSIPLQAAYCGAKHAMLGFSSSLRCELLHDGSNVQVCLVHLPALNTPQFDQVRNRLPHEPQPVPPIFQPEVAADAIVWLSGHPRRELWVGWPTVQAILGQRVAPGLLDRYLARTGYDAQQTDQPVSPDGRRDNLDEPLPGDLGAHGDFDDRARTRTHQQWLARRRGLLTAAGGAALAATGAALAHAKSRR